MLSALLIDDDMIEKMNLEKTLQKSMTQGFNLYHATSIEDGMKVLAENSIDIVFLDDNLGIGPESKNNTISLRSVSDKVPIIVISNFVDADHLSSGAFITAYDIVDKSDLSDRIKSGLLNPFLPS